MKTQITAIFFDLGEVLLTNDWTFPNEAKDKEFEEYYQISNFSYIHNPYFKEIMTGKISETEYWTRALTFFSAATNHPHKAIEIQRKYQQEKPGMFELVTRLKNNGYRLGIISSIHRELLDWKIKKFDLNKYFEIIISSGYFGKQKPDHSIYYEALNQINVPAKQIIFVDDSKKNVEAANEIGIHGVLFQGDEGSEILENKLKEKGVQI